MLLDDVKNLLRTTGIFKREKATVLQSKCSQILRITLFFIFISGYYLLSVIYILKYKSFLEAIKKAAYLTNSMLILNISYVKLLINNQTILQSLNTWEKGFCDRMRVKLLEFCSFAVLIRKLFLLLSYRNYKWF